MIERNNKTIVAPEEMIFSMRLRRELPITSPMAAAQIEDAIRSKLPSPRMVSASWTFPLIISINRK